MNVEDINTGEHFWGILKGEGLCVFIKTHENEYYVCGGWEVNINPEDIYFIELIKIPTGYENKVLAYSN